MLPLSKRSLSASSFPIEVGGGISSEQTMLLQRLLKPVCRRVVFLGTDKAAYPINTMGMTKAVGEKVVQARTQKVFERDGTVLVCTLYGNVMCDCGFAIPLFFNQIKRMAPIAITDSNLIRFLRILMRL
jgi:FlaA1/EpsC-like NDP-sugar epimerase